MTEFQECLLAVFGIPIIILAGMVLNAACLWLRDLVVFLYYLHKVK